MPPARRLAAGIWERVERRAAARPERGTTSSAPAPRSLADSAAPRPPAPRSAYAWLFVLCLLYQLRFFRQLPVFVSMLAVNAFLLPDICALHHPEMRPARCVAVGLARALIQLAISLALVAGLEIRARRIWMLGQLAAAAPAPAPAAGRPQEGRADARPP